MVANEVEKVRDDLYRALERFGEHKSNCHLRLPAIIGGDKPQCTCGLDDALGPTEET